jgi:hypothetical protein
MIYKNDKPCNLITFYKNLKRFNLRLNKPKTNSIVEILFKRIAL